MSYTLCLNMIEVELKQWGKRRKDGFGICSGARPFIEENEPHKELW